MMTPMILAWRRLALIAARKLAENPDARAKAADLARKARREVGRIVDSDDPAHAAGRAVRRARDDLRRRLRARDP